MEALGIFAVLALSIGLAIGMTAVGLRFLLQLMG